MEERSKEICEQFEPKDLIRTTRAVIIEGKKKELEVIGFLVKGTVFNRVLDPVSQRVVDVVHGSIRPVTDPEIIEEYFPADSTDLVDEEQPDDRDLVDDSNHKDDPDLVEDSNQKVVDPDEVPFGKQSEQKKK
jgi:hypothetical protein